MNITAADAMEKYTEHIFLFGLHQFPKTDRQ